MVTVGCALGSALIPVSAGYLFAHVSPMAIWHLNLALVLAQMATAVAIAAILRGGAKLDRVGGVSYEKLAQLDKEEEEEMLEEVNLRSD